MMSRLLRRLLLAQVTAGALLGWLIASQTGSGAWPIIAMALALPPLSTLVTVFTSTRLSRAPGQPGLGWRSLLDEYGASIRVFLLRQPWAPAPPLARPATLDPARIPVLLVHGFLCNGRVWDLMAKRLLQAGHAVARIDLEPPFSAIEAYVPLVEHAVMELCRQSGTRHIALVGHSMGGLTIRAWMRAHGTNRVARVLTLGSPHAGTRMAELSATENARQMRWRSAWLRELAASEPASTRHLMRIALTPQDNIVYPQHEQVLAGVPVTVFDGLGHLSLCFDENVFRWVLLQLKNCMATEAKAVSGGAAPVM
jgi:triacylglycerol lipase